MKEQKYRIVWIEYENKEPVFKEDFVTASYVTFDSFGPAFLIENCTWCPSWYDLPNAEIRIWS